MFFRYENSINNALNRYWKALHNRFNKYEGIKLMRLESIFEQFTDVKLYKLYLNQDTNI